MTTDIDKLAQQMREAAGEATPGPWEAHEIDLDDPDLEAFEIWNHATQHSAGGSVGNGVGTASLCIYGRANARHIVTAHPAAVLALLDDRERLWAALKLAAAQLAHYEPVAPLIRDALATSGGGNG